MEDSRISRLSIEFTRAKQEEQDRISFSKEDRSNLPTYHRISLSELANEFKVPSVEQGLLDEEVTASRKEHGENVMSPPKRHPLKMWLGFFFGGFNGFLWFAAALSWVAWALGFIVRPNIWCQLRAHTRCTPLFDFLAHCPNADLAFLLSIVTHRTLSRFLYCVAFHRTTEHHLQATLPSLSP